MFWNDDAIADAELSMLERLVLDEGRVDENSGHVLHDTRTRVDPEHVGNTEREGFQQRHGVK